MKNEKEIKNAIVSLYKFCAEIAKGGNIDFAAPKVAITNGDILESQIKKLRVHLESNERIIKHYENREKSLEKSLQVHKEEIMRLENLNQKMKNILKSVEGEKS